MKLYSILGQNHEIIDQEDLIAVRDGFSFLAFLFAPIWFLWRGMWLHALLIFCLYVGVSSLPFGDFQTAILLVIALFIGFEARFFYLEFLQKQGLMLLGNVQAPDSDLACGIYCDIYLAEQKKSPMKAPSEPLQTPANIKPVSQSADMFFGRS